MELKKIYVQVVETLVLNKGVSRVKLKVKIARQFVSLGQIDIGGGQCYAEEVNNVYGYMTLEFVA